MNKIQSLARATLATAVLIVIPVAASARPVVTEHPKDVCKNVKGVQTASEIEAGYWSPIWRTQRPNDCRPGPRQTLR